MPLSTRARNLLRDVSQRLSQAPIVQKPRGRVVEEIIDWLDEQHIEPGPNLSHAWIRFDRDLLVRIEASMALSGQAPLAVDLSGMESLEQARHGRQEEKGVRAGPRERRVLISLPACVPRSGMAPAVREVLDLDRHRLDLNAFDVLLQLENLDGFYALPAEIPTLSPWPRPLILYRGDSLYGGGFAALAADWVASGRPHLYLGDFDARGIGIALASGATHLLLPPLEWLGRHASGEHQPPEQQSYQAALRVHAAGLPAEHPLLDYLAILLGEQRGLRQQWFGHALTRVPLG